MARPPDVPREPAPSPPAASAPVPDPAGDRSADEHDLIRRAQSGDESAFAALVRESERRAWRVARNLVPSDEDASDLVQEAYLRVFRNLERFDFQHSFGTWLYRIVTNLAIDHLRKRRPVQSTASGEEGEPDLDLWDPQAPSPSAAMEAGETAREVRACLETLAPHFQSALVLRELEGLPCTEIAEIVGATHVTVRWRLHRGRRLFQEAWERRGRAARSIPPNAADGANAAPPAGVTPLEHDGTAPQLP